MKKMNISLVLKALATGCILGAVRNASATEPYETLSTTSPSGAYRVEQRPRWNDAVAIFDSSDRLLFSLPITNVLQHCKWTGKYGEDYEVSTAGLNWHLNSIAYIAPRDATFIMRHRSGNYIAIDLVDGQPRPITQDEASAADIRVRETALSWLDSPDSRDRETGCIHCGQLGATQAVARLRELLADKEFYTVGGGDDPEPIAVLSVRKAAVEALVALGQKADHIQYEFPEKEVVKWDENTSRYVVVLPEEENLEPRAGPPPQGAGPPEP